LHYHAIDSPLAQPRNALISQVLASVLGVSITKLFQLSPHFSSLRFLAGALSVSLSSALMGLTNTVHPPAGATALLAATSPEIVRLGWFLVPLVLLGVVLMLFVACLVNNIQRRFPVYWWTATPLPLITPPQKDIERQDSTSKFDWKGSESTTEIEFAAGETEKIVISAEHVVLPAYVEIGPAQMAMLEDIQAQLREGLRVALRRTSTMDTDDTKVYDSFDFGFEKQ
jgi:hypothetical protein